MRTQDFEYHLPPELIAQRPTVDRDQSRLLVVNRDDGSLIHAHFCDLHRFLSAGDLVIGNNTRVLKARLHGHRQATKGKWEGLFLREDDQGRWEMLSQARGRLRPGEFIAIDSGTLALELIEQTAEGHWLARPRPKDDSARTTAELLERHAHVPLPPYIRKGRADEEDDVRYQTVFASRQGAVAAPTAGLHFTPQLLESLRRKDIGYEFVTLHIGLGTFRPIQANEIEDHVMHAEWGEIDASVAARIRQCRAAGRRVAAVGTTSVRVLETAATADGTHPWSGFTDLYIRPGFQFRAVDVLVTNFHLPRSSLLVLVSTFAGIELIRRAYMTAVQEGYRFYSYGDAMLIL